MGLWKQAKQVRRPAQGVALAAARGASRDELIVAALEELRERSGADRIGVWLAETPGDDRCRGQVRDAGLEATPEEWNRLGLEAIFPQGLRYPGRSIAQQGREARNGPLIGPLVGLRRVLWAPVEGTGEWHGLLLAGWKTPGGAQPREAIEAVAAELALALNLREAEEAARERARELAFARRVLTGGGKEADEKELRGVLRQGARDAGMQFLAVGRLAGESAEVPILSWTCTDGPGAAQLESEPLRSLWTGALESGRETGAGPAAALPESGCERWIAAPLEADGKRLGVLVAGLRRGHATLGALEWLRLRGALAAQVLSRRSLEELESGRAARLRRSVEAAEEPILLLGEGGRIAALNGAARRLAGGAAAGDFFAGLFAERERAEAWLRQEREGATAGRPLEGALCSGASVRARQPLPVGAVGPAREDLQAVYLDVREEACGRGAEEAREREFHALLEWMEQGVVLVDAEQKIRAMNARFREMAGLDAGEAGRILTLEDLIERVAERAQEPVEMARHWREIAAGGEGGVREEVHLARPAPRVLERAARPVWDEAGRRIGWLEIYRDRTAERLFQARLQQSEKLAALGQMLSGIAHELSNPVTSILGYAQRLLLREDRAENEEVRQIYQEAGRAGRMLRQLLESGRETRPERQPVSLNQIVLRALELRRFGAPAERVRVETSLDPQVPLLAGDVDRLQQVVLNLVANAQQAIEQGRGRGTVRVATRRTGDGRLQLEVSDDGPGIPPALLARIFEPFFTTKPAGVGTGLGLSIARDIVREHGGQVRAANGPGGGAVFTVELPIPEPEHVAPVRERTRPERPAPISSGPSPAAPPEAPVAERKLEALPGGRRAAGARVLVVEDEPTVARLIADVLRDEGMNVEVLHDGHKALDRVARRSYDLVICDLKMPGLDGQHIFQALARQGSPLCERFLFVTGDALSAPTMDFLKRNRLVCVHKPFRVDELTRAVRETLKTGAASAKQAAGRTRT